MNEEAGKAFCTCMEKPVSMNAEEKENPGTYTQEEMDEAMASMDECLEKIKRAI